MAERSIHYRRRWFYVLWCTLLAGAFAALGLWETPARREKAALETSVLIRGVPEGTRVQAWAGPLRAWPGSRWNGEGAWADLALPRSGAVPLPLIRLPIARRRLGRGYIPRGTWDLVVVRLLPPSGPPRYLPYECSKDITSGLLAQGHRLKVTISGSWEHLPVDAEAFLRVP